ncbi:hypothetical protein [Actinomadura monticuli]|uniref:Uncharacterized protein n=1 Tax=Actinomadura monticuli TaxID=3097367 RepID=A0ABV4QCX5_9ACTN
MPRAAEELRHLVPEQLRPQVADAALAVHPEGGVVVEDVPGQHGIGDHPSEPGDARDRPGVPRGLQEREQAGVGGPQQPRLVPRRSARRGRAGPPGRLCAGHPVILPG